MFATLKNVDTAAARIGALRINFARKAWNPRDLAWAVAWRVLGAGIDAIHIPDAVCASLEFYAAN